MAKNKTAATTRSVDDFISHVEKEEMREDSYALINITKAITKEEAKMWGPSIIGFGTHHYKYASGHEGDMPMAAFSPRKTALVVYISSFPEKEELQKKLGKYKSTTGCLYIKKLADVDMAVLKKLITGSFKNVKKNYPS